MTAVRDRITQAANVVLAGGAAVSILLLVYVVYHYLLIGDRTFSSRFGMLLYCGIPIILASAFLISLRQSAATKAGLAMIFLSMGFSIYVGELVVYFFNPLAVSSNSTIPTPPPTAKEMNELVTLAQSFGVRFDTRSKLDVISDFQGQGIEAVPSIVPAGLLKTQEDGVIRPVIQVQGGEMLPLAGISNRYTVLCNEVGEFLSYWSDEHGFHNPKGAWAAGSADIAAVGDSYVHGACVGSEENFLAHVRRRYPATINLGIAGNGPLLELATLVEYARPLRPKVVFWFFYEGNDLQNLSDEKDSPLLMRYLESDFSQGLINLQGELDTALTGYVEIEREEFLESQVEPGKPLTARAVIGTVREIAVLSNLRRRLGLVYGEAEEVQDPTRAAEEEDLLLRTLQRAREVVGEWGGTLYFVYLPARERYADARFAAASEEIRDRVLRVAASANVSTVDIHQTFQAHNDPLALFPFRRLGHYNGDGNRIVADELLKAITSDVHLQSANQ